MLNKLRTPVALVVEGFVAGALIFTAVNPSYLHARTSAADIQAAALVRQLTR